jgi:hypothetical protein
VGVWYSLINRTKQECIVFARLPAATAPELAGHPDSAAVTTWYLLQNRGDEIAFVSDEDEDWPFAEGAPDEVTAYREVTDAVVEQLIQAGILRDEGVIRTCEDDPEVYHRVLRNVWFEDKHGPA